jgi:hypothetical protein
MQDQLPTAGVAGRFGAGRTLLASFDHPEDAAAALEKLLGAGFINVEQETEGRHTVLVLDAGERQAEARAIFAEHDGVDLDPPS